MRTYTPSGPSLLSSLLPHFTHTLCPITAPLPHSPSSPSLHYNEDLLVNLHHEKQGLEEELETEESQIQTLSDILEAVTM